MRRILYQLRHLREIDKVEIINSPLLRWSGFESAMAGVKQDAPFSGSAPNMISFVRMPSSMLTRKRA